MLKKPAPGANETAVGYRNAHKDRTGIKMSRASSQNVWTAARPATGWSPDNSVSVNTRYQLAAVEKYQGELHLFKQLPTAPRGQSGAARCSSHLPIYTTLLHEHGDIITFSIPLHEASTVKKKKKNMTRKIITQGHGRNNKGSITKRPFCRRKLCLASTRVTHHKVYHHACCFSRGGGWSMD